MRGIVNFILTVLFFALQCTLFRTLEIGGITPNLLMILTVSTAFMQGERAGALTGFLGGILSDIFFGSYIGFLALLYTVCGYLAGKVHRAFFPQNIILPMTLIVTGDFVYGFMCYVLMFLFRTRFDISFYMRNVVIPEVVYTTIAAIFFYPVLLKIHTSLEAYERRNSRKFI